MNRFRWTSCEACTFFIHSDKRSFCRSKATMLRTKKLNSDSSSSSSSSSRSNFSKQTKTIISQIEIDQFASNLGDVSPFCSLLLLHCMCCLDCLVSFFLLFCHVLLSTSDRRHTVCTVSDRTDTQQDTRSNYNCN